MQLTSGWLPPQAFDYASLLFLPISQSDGLLIRWSQVLNPVSLPKNSTIYSDAKCFFGPKAAKVQRKFNGGKNRLNTPARAIASEN
jgi:hypothetical protein